MEKIIYLVSFYVVAKQKLHQAILNSQKGLYSCERGRRETSSEFSLNSTPLKQRQESLWRLSAKFLDKSVLVNWLYPKQKSTVSYLFFFLFAVNFVIHWNETAMGLHVFPMPIPPPTFLSTRSLWVFPVHQVRALVSCIQPGLVICFTLDNVQVSMLFSWNIPPSPSPTESKRLFYKSVSFFFFCSAYKLSLTSF